MQFSILELLIAALIGFVPIFIALLRMRRIGKAEREELLSRATSQSADAVGSLSETVVRLSDRLQQLECKSRQQTIAIYELGDKLEQAQKLIRLLVRGVTILMGQLTDLGAAPDFVIPIPTNDDDLEALLAQWLP